jgi:hypothetical protein
MEKHYHNFLPPANLAPGQTAILGQLTMNPRQASALGKMVWDHDRIRRELLPGKRGLFINATYES